jgi:hypothetical protein
MKKGTQIAYVPTHAKGDPRGLKHPSVEFGFVMSESPRGVGHFCRYWLKGKLGQLRTTANSELTPTDNLVVYQSVDALVVDEALAQIAREDGSLIERNKKYFDADA